MRKQYLYNRDGLSQMLNSQLRQLSDSDIGLLFQMMKQLLLRQTPALTNIPAGITLFISMICIIVKSRNLVKTVASWFCPLVRGESGATGFGLPT